MGAHRALVARGCGVELIDPAVSSFEVHDGSWLELVDIVVARGRSPSLLYMLHWAELRGRPTINGRHGTAAVHNKAEMAIELAAAGFPTPPTWLGSPQKLVRSVPAAGYPLVLKPIFGDNCRGLRLVEDAAQLARTEWPEPTALAQEYVPGDGVDLKLYGIGDRVWAVRKPSPLRSAVSGPEPVRLTSEMAALAQRCARLFGLELYGLDCVETSDGPVVIEVNEFPNYTAVPNADDRLADYVVQRAAAGALR